MNDQLRRRSILALIGLTLCCGAPAGASEGGALVHVVLIWLKEPGNPEHRARLIDGSHELARIPGVREIRVGASVPSTRDIVDDSFDVGLYMIFANSAELEAYLVDERHLSMVDALLRPLAARYIVYDFIDTAAGASAADGVPD